MKKAFSMMEIIFVIVIIGILAGVAAPKILASRDDAEMLKLKETVALIRTGIEAYSNDILYSKGVKEYPTGLCTNSSGAKQCASGDKLFSAISKQTFKTGAGKHSWTFANTGDIKTQIFIYNAGSDECRFMYDNEKGKFECKSSNECCAFIETRVQK